MTDTSGTEINELRVDGERLWRSLMQLAEVGATPDGGCNRVALTDPDRAGQQRFEEWAAAAGCRITRDRIGTLFAHRTGDDVALPPIVIGSHLDTQPVGGFIRSRGGPGGRAHVERPRHPYTRAPSWSSRGPNEKGARFPLPLTGSGVFAGQLSLEQALTQRALDGPSFGDELDRLELAGPAAVGDPAIGAYFEIHIEQNTLLESRGNVIGVVGRGQGVRALRVIITGVSSHAGTTAMGDRRDALVGAARIVELASSARRDDALVTVGQLEVEPNSRSVIPGRVVLVVDMRHPEPAALDEVERGIRAGVMEVAAAAGLAVEQDMFLDIPPVIFDEGCNEAVRRACRELEVPYMHLISGAGHDAMNIARVAPSALVFIPCRDGISHNPAEYASPEHTAAGCDVLLRATMTYAGISDR